MINQQNIGAFINYLHQKRNGSNAPNDLLEKWGQLQNADIPIQLQNLYNSWGLDSNASKAHEQNFIQFTNPTIVKITPAQTTNFTPNEASTTIHKPSKSKFLPRLLSMLLLGGIVGGVFAFKDDLLNKLFNNNASESSSINSSTTEPSNTYPEAAPVSTEPAAEIAAPTPAIENNPTPTATKTASNSPNLPNANTQTASESDLTVTQIDKENIQNISNLLDAEQSRNFESIASYFAPDMKQYWDISYPTKEELETRYNAVWQKVADGRNTDMKVSKIGNRKYRITGNYNYFSIAKQENKSVKINIIFEFDENGKIIYTNKAN